MAQPEARIKPKSIKDKVKNNDFSLLGLIAVTAIVAILAAISIPLLLQCENKIEKAEKKYIDNYSTYRGRRQYVDCKNS